jgi:NitT/TauT family transport system ATP-binding protein
MSNQPEVLLSINDVNKSFTNSIPAINVISGLSLQVREGDFISIVGPSGCGKSTLLHLIAGFDRDYSGEMTFCGEKIISPSTRRGILFQSPQLFPWLKVKDNIAFGLKLQHLPADQIEMETQTYLERVGMTDFQNFYPDQLSGGMQQRIALARALVMKPKLLLMDEPFSSLDYQTRLEMHQLTLKLWNEYKPSILFVTHDIEEALLLSDKIFILSERPASLVREIAVPFQRPRELSLIKTLPFNQLKAEILDLLFVLKE